jgi:predicted regulator of Ras-like GTPase activity (Roadblock/LC7/MglB family)
MENILKDVNAVVGVTGSFVCDGEGQVLAKLLPNIFDETLLLPVGRTMSQTIAGLRIARRRKVGDIDLLYDQGRLIVKSAGEGCLCVICVRRINVPLLNLTANVAARKLARQLKADQAAPIEEPSLREARAPSPQQASLTVNSTFFSQVERELTRLMGPMATFVLEEQVAALGSVEEALTRDKAHQFVERLAAEIEDEDKRAGFQQVALEILDKVT